MNSNKSDDKETKSDVLFMGAARVGKTTLLHNILLTDNSPALQGRYRPTIEDSYVCDFLVHNRCYQLRLVDTAGSYDFPAMQRLWIKKAAAFILVCARDSPQSIDHLMHLIPQLKKERGKVFKHLLLVIVLNKCDLPMKEWLVSDEDVELLAEEFEIPYSSIIFTSARTEMGITELLRTLWEQNEEAVIPTIPWVIRDKSSEMHRRFSAFAVLFRQNPPQQPPAISEELTNDDKDLPSNKGRSYAASFSGPSIPNSRRFPSVSHGSPGWLVKTFRKLSLGGTPRTRFKHKHNGPQTIIELNCIIS